MRTRYSQIEVVDQVLETGIEDDVLPFAWAAQAEIVAGPLDDLDTLNPLFH